MALHVILGKGPVGSTLADRLVEHGHDVRVLSRSGAPAGAPGVSGDSHAGHVEHVAIDAADATALTAASRGATTLYNCANPPYHRWEQQWPPMAQALLTAAETTGAGLVTMGNLYPYGPVDGPMVEGLPDAAPGRKARVRARMWEQLLARQRAGALRVTEARASDFVGPRVVDDGFLGARVVPRVLAGKGVQALDAADQPHSWTAMADVATALAALGTDERAWGRIWHVPTAPPVTFREAVQGLCAAAGVAPVKVTTLPHLLVRAAGLAVPKLRELEETRYQRTTPYVLDSSAFTATFGVAATSLERTWTDTVAWWRDRTAVSA